MTPIKSFLVILVAWVGFADAQERTPKSEPANLGQDDVWHDKWEKGFNELSELIRLNPDKACNYCYRGDVWAMRKQYQKACLDYGHAIRLEPEDPFLYWNRGLYLQQLEEWDKAIADFTEVIRLEAPYIWLAYMSRGSCYRQKHDYARAIDDSNEAIRLTPNHAWTYLLRGSTWHAMKEYDKAIADFDEAIRLAPKFALPYERKAWIWATCPNLKYRDGKKAIESATRACEMTEWKKGIILGTLAAAYAEVGDFGKAVEYQEKAQRLYSEDEKKKWSKLLDLYRDKKPYRNAD